MAAHYDNPAELQEVEAYLDELRTQDDRSCVIMIAARIESLLERAIDQRLIEPRSKRRKGFVPSFASAIDLSHRLGILHSTHADALHALRGIRNAAAHFDRPMSLEDRRQEVEKFCRPWTEGRTGRLFRSLRDRELNRSATSSRGLFLVGASIFLFFFTPLSTVVPQLERLRWLRGLDA